MYNLFLDMYVVLASNLLQHAVPVFTKKNRFGSLCMSARELCMDGKPMHGVYDVK